MSAKNCFVSSSNPAPTELAYLALTEIFVTKPVAGPYQFSLALHLRYCLPYPMNLKEATQDGDTGYTRNIYKKSYQRPGFVHS
jgi:hypothetical protein